MRNELLLHQINKNWLVSNYLGIERKRQPEIRSSLKEMNNIRRAQLAKSTQKSLSTNDSDEQKEDIDSSLDLCLEQLEAAVRTLNINQPK